MTTDWIPRAWTGIEAHFPPAGVRMQMHALLGRRALAALEAAKVVIPGLISNRFPCPSPGAEGCPRQIHDNGDGTFIAFCGRNPPECDDVLLPEDDVRMLRFDRDGFAAALRRLLGITGRTEWLPGLPNVCRLGALVPEPGTTYPIFFASRCAPADYAACFDVLMAQTPGEPFAVLVPTRWHISHDAERRLAAAGVVLIALIEVFGTLTVSDQDNLAVLADRGRLFERLGQGAPSRAGKDAVIAQAIVCSGGKFAWRDLNQDAYDGLVAAAAQYDIFADYIKKTCAKTARGKRMVRRDIPAGWFQTIRNAIDCRANYDPATGGSDDNDSGKQTFQRARHAFDLGSRQKWKVFKTDMVDKVAMYRFDPDADVSFAYIFAPNK